MSRYSGKLQRMGVETWLKHVIYEKMCAFSLAEGEAFLAEMQDSGLSYRDINIFIERFRAVADVLCVYGLSCRETWGSAEERALFLLDLLHKKENEVAT